MKKAIEEVITDTCPRPAMISLYVQPCQLTTDPQKRNELAIYVENNHFFNMTKLQDRQAKYLFKIYLKLINDEIVIESATVIIFNGDYNTNINFTAPFACCPHGNQDSILFVCVNGNTNNMYLFKLRDAEKKSTLLYCEIERCPND